MTTKKAIEENIKKEQSALRILAETGISVDMTRGRPSKEQLLVAMPMLENAYRCEFFNGISDARNYGELAGEKSARQLFAEIFEVESDEVIVGDGSSLDLMYTLIQFAMQFGVSGYDAWNKLDEVKFVCPSPGYDRHFFICEQFGIKMLTVPMLESGPDMEVIEKLVAADESIKGVWCVPKYSNPTGIVFSDETVDRFARLKPKAKDFRIFWDNAYIIHSLYDEDVDLKNIFRSAKEYGTEDMIYEFTSTSKITFAGSGVAAVAASQKNVKEILNRMSYKIINPNKVNQIMHVAFLKDKENVREIMRMHASILRPKFELFDKKMKSSFKDDKNVRWTTPKGGYFISLDVPGCARRVVDIAMSAGVKFTAAGSTFPYAKDNADSNVRIAPSVPTLEELEFATDVLIHAIRLARLEIERESCADGRVR